MWAVICSVGGDMLCGGDMLFGRLYIVWTVICSVCCVVCDMMCDL